MKEEGRQGAQILGDAVSGVLMGKGINAGGPAVWLTVF